MTRFSDRRDAGKHVARMLMAYKRSPDTVVFGLPRGGVVVAYEVARELELPLDIMVPRKVGAPFNEELAVGAVTQDGQMVWNEQLVKSLHLNRTDMRETIKKETSEAQRRLQLYRHGKGPLAIKGKTVILVDDGIATGATMRAAIVYARQQAAKKIVVAVPVATVDTLEIIEKEADEVVSVMLPKIFLGISAFYDSFPQTEDEEVISLLQSQER